jgi:hypothetical protein
VLEGDLVGCGSRVWRRRRIWAGKKGWLLGDFGEDGKGRVLFFVGEGSVCVTGVRLAWPRGEWAVSGCGVAVFFIVLR